MSQSRDSLEVGRGNLLRGIDNKTVFEDSEFLFVFVFQVLAIFIFEQIEIL